jgi:hypothetical protein
LRSQLESAGTATLTIIIEPGQSVPLKA